MIGACLNSVVTPAWIGVHPLFGRDTVSPRHVKVPFPRSFHTLLLSAWRAEERKGKLVLGVTFFIILDFPSILAQSRLVHPPGSVRGNLFAHQII